MKKTLRIGSIVSHDFSKGEWKVIAKNLDPLWNYVPLGPARYRFTIQSKTTGEILSNVRRKDLNARGEEHFEAMRDQ